MSSMILNLRLKAGFRQGLLALLYSLSVAIDSGAGFSLGTAATQESGL